MRTIDPIAHIRSNREIYLPAIGDVSIYLAQRLSSDAMVLGANEVDVARAGEWWTVSADTDWLAKPCECAVEKLFNQVIPFPQAGPNSMRSEILLTAFARDVVTSNDRETKVIKGSVPATDPMPDHGAHTAGTRGPVSSLRVIRSNGVASLAISATIKHMTRIGIIGLGFMGRTHYEAYQKLPDAQVVMVADQDPKRAAGDLSGGWGNFDAGNITQLPMDRIRGTTDFHELMNDPDVDVIDICVPTPGHVDLTLAALASGKNVMCEKPLATSSADAMKIATAAKAARGFFMPAMCVRFWPEWEWLKRAVADEKYGPVRAATFRRLGSMPAGWFKEGKLSGGAVVDLHVHDTDFIYHLFGKPHGVFSRGYTKTSGEIDHIITQYFFDKYPLVVAEGGWCQADGWPFAMKYTVNFERATADYDSSRADGAAGAL